MLFILVLALSLPYVALITRKWSDKVPSSRNGGYAVDNGLNFVAPSIAFLYFVIIGPIALALADKPYDELAKDRKAAIESLEMDKNRLSGLEAVVSSWPESQRENSSTYTDIIRLRNSVKEKVERKEKLVSTELSPRAYVNPSEEIGSALYLIPFWDIMSFFLLLSTFIVYALVTDKMVNTEIFQRWVTKLLRGRDFNSKFPPYSRGTEPRMLFPLISDWNKGDKIKLKEGLFFSDAYGSSYHNSTTFKLKSFDDRGFFIKDNITDNTFLWYKDMPLWESHPELLEVIPAQFIEGNDSELDYGLKTQRIENYQNFCLQFAKEYKKQQEIESSAI